MGKLYKNIEAWIKSNSSDEAKTLEIEALFENREKHLMKLLSDCFDLLPDGDYPEVIIDLKRELHDVHLKSNMERVDNLPKKVNYYCETHIIQLINSIEELLPNDNPVLKTNSFKYLKNAGENF